MIGDEKRYRETLERGIEIAAAGANIVVLGIRPNRAETGYGYIEAGSAFQGEALRVRRFTEKPDAKKAAEFVAAGNYFWNSGMFLWSARTLADALREHLPKTAPLLEEIAAAFGTRKFAADVSQAVSQVRKHQRGLCGAGAAFGERRSRRETFSACRRILAGTIWVRGRRCTSITPQRAIRRKAIWWRVLDVFLLNARGNYIHAPGKFVAAVGVSDLVVVETPDALLITTRQHAQDVGKVVKYLDEKKLHKLT